MVCSQDYPKLTIDEEDDLFAEECEAITAALTSTSMALPPLVIEDEHEQPLGKGTVTIDNLDLHQLVKVRQAHQTAYAAKGLRTRQTKPSANSNTEDETAQRKLLNEFHKLFRGSRIGTGLERSVRWKEKQPATGNAANAQLASGLTAKQVDSRLFAF